MSSIFDSLPDTPSALERCQRVKDALQNAGFVWPDNPLEKVYEELDELKAEVDATPVDRARATAELGDVFFILVDIARRYGLNADEAVRIANTRIEGRFRHIEQNLLAGGKDFSTASLEEIVTFWKEAKALEKQTQDAA